MLSKNDKLHGYENYTAWKTLMEAHGQLKGLHKYWGNLVTVPTSITTSITAPTTPSQTTVTTATPPPGPTPVHSTNPSELEYELHESCIVFYPN